MSDGSDGQRDLQALLKQSLTRVRELKARLAEAESAGSEPIAIVGMGCRFPGGADDPDAFWALLREGRDAVRRIPDSRWPADARWEGHPGTRWAGLLEDVRGFDAEFFGISPREALSLDPQHRLLLEVSWEALEDAGSPPPGLGGSDTGVFIGVSTQDYHHRVVARDPAKLDAWTTTGNGPCFAAGRLSFTYGLQGPSVSIDTACSSSLVAVHLACRSLLAGECSRAIAGGVNLILSPLTMFILAQTQALSPDGRCRTFDARANGFVRGEGCGVVVLKRLSAALRDGDRIRAVIRSSAVNQDGRSTGLTTPNVLAQQALLRKALEIGRIDPARVGFIEAHGTGTSLGDPIELEALRDVYPRRPDGAGCAVSSVKTNIGHLEAAAGVAGLIKVILSLEHGLIPRHLHFQTLNPRIRLEGTPFVIPRQELAWPVAGSPRVAGVSSFGLSGTNAHVLLEQAPEPPRDAARLERPVQVLALSAHTPQALRDLADRVARHLRTHPAQDVRDVCFTANTSRTCHAHRLALVAGSREALAADLEAWASGSAPEGSGVFAGAGSERPATPEDIVLEAGGLSAEGWESLATRVARLYARGASIDWHGWEGTCRRQRVSLPGYPFQRRPHWLEAAAHGTWGTSQPTTSRLAHPLLGTYTQVAGREALFEPDLHLPALSFLAEHQVFGVALAPMALFLELARAAANSLYGPGSHIVEKLTVHLPLRLDPETGGQVQVLVGVPDGEAAPFELYSSSGEQTGTRWQRHVSATLRRAAPEAAPEPMGEPDAVAREELSVTHCYRDLAVRGVAYGPAFQGLQRLERAPGDAVARIGLPEPLEPDPERFGIHPALLDSAIQTLGAALPSADDGALSLPIGLERFVLYRPQPRSARVRASLRPTAGDADVLLGDVRLYDGDDALLALLEGIQLRRAAPGALRRGVLPARDGALYGLEWVEAPLPSDARPAEPAGRWLLLCDRSGVGESLAARLEADGHRCFRASAGTLFRVIGPDRFEVDPARPESLAALLAATGAGATEGDAADRVLTGVVHLWALDAPDVPDAPEGDAAEAVAGGALHLVQALQHAHEGVPPRLWLVTRGAHGPEGTVTAPSQAALWGLGRVLQREMPGLRSRLVDLDPTTGAGWPEALTTELQGDDRADQVAWRQGVRRTARLRRITEGSARGRPGEVRRDGEEAADSPGAGALAPTARVRPDGTYLVTGGLGGVGLRIAAWLVDRGARHLALAGRRDPGPEARERIAALEAAGASIRTFQVDVSDGAQVAALLSQLDAPAPLAGIFHAAGVLDDGVLQAQRLEAFARVLAPKVAGAFHLHRLTLERRLDHFVLCSSVASLLGPPGQAAYAAANAVLDALAHHRRARGLPALAVNWGLWDGVGMAAGLEARDRQRLSAQGLGTLSPAEAIELLEQAIALERPQVAALALQSGGLPPDAARGLLSALLPAASPGASSPAETTALLVQLHRASPERRRDVLREAVRTRAARVLGLGAPGELNPQRPLRDLGLDSLMAVELRNTLAEAVGRPLPATLVFDFPTVDGLAGFLLEQVLEAPVEDSPGGLEPVHPTLEPIALIGLACRFPGGADTPQAFWSMLEQGVDAITEVPPERWDVDAWYDPDPDAPDRMYTRWGGFLKDVDRFDAEFFGISPREATAMDPQQRLLLEVAWEALERAGQPAERIQGSPTGMFLGIMGHDYGDQDLSEVPDRHEIDAYFGTGNAFSVAAGRVAYVLGLEGPCLALDTACSSSLVAVHLACQSLRAGECALALAAGVNLILSPQGTIYCSRLRAASPDGRCKTFDASANGYVRSEGCGVVVLKPLSKALADGDRVMGVIRGSAVNHDGRSNGLTAPNGLAQQAVIRRALAQAGVAPHEVGYVEAHGTGTPLGDPIELQALGAALGRGRAADRPLIVGSVKTNLGHAEGAAGVAGLIKAVLALQHGRIPAHLHLREPNPLIPWDRLPVRVPQVGLPWPGGGRRIAGVSSFGVSGTNAHVVLEAPPEPGPVSATPDGPQLFVLSARSEPALEASIRAYVRYLDRQPDLPLPELCAAVARGRTAFAQRLAIVASSLDQLRADLEALAAGTEPASCMRGVTHPGRQPAVAFLFTGDEAAYAGMGRLLADEPAFRAALEQCDAVTQPRLERPLLERIEAGDAEPIADAGPSRASMLFGLEYALAALWQSRGVVPLAVYGQGTGEYVAACVAGVISLEEAVQRATLQGRLPAHRGGEGGQWLEPPVSLTGSAQPGRIRWISSRSATAVASVPGAEHGEQPTGVSYDLAEAMPALREAGCDTFLEVGPHPVLMGTGAAQLGAVEATWLPSLVRGQDDRRVLLASLGRLFVSGLPARWAPRLEPLPAVADLPTYPFQRQRYWIDRAGTTAETAGSGDKPARPPSPTAVSKPRPEGELIRMLEQAPPGRRRELLTEHLEREVASVLGLAPPALPGRQQGFFDLGMDSLMAVELKKRLEAASGVGLPSTLAFDLPNLEALSRYLARELLDLETPDAPLRSKRRTTRSSVPEAVAIIGMGCRLPGGANDPAAFWRLLEEGVDAITEVPPDRWDADAFYDPDPSAPGRMNTRCGGFLRDVAVDGFDARFFGISPREAQSMDPQQRLLLEVAWEALEDAGQAADRLAGSRTGVYVGITSSDYATRAMALREGDTDPWAGTGNSFSVAAGRLAFVLGLQGPAVAMDTTCSSSLVALHLACQALRLGEADLALAGGVNLLLEPWPTVYFSKLRALAPDGRCKTFDAAADGYVRSEGCGMLVLKRLSDALEDGDELLAVIRGSAINHDGRSSGLTVPNGPAQQAVLRAALDAAAVTPAEVGYVEAHGTGTPLGDPIEAGALAAVMAPGRAPDRPLYVGSVKTNIGHLEAAAGVAGVIKVVQMLRHGRIPAHLHYRRSNPHLSWGELPVHIPVTAVPWPEGRRIAGVSAFGMSGTNAHLVLEQAPVREGLPARATVSAHLLPLSARSPAALRQLARDWQVRLSAPDGEETPLTALCASASRRRSHLEHRIAVAGRSPEGLQSRLEAAIRDIRDAAPPAGGLRPVFVFSGHGSQWAGMGRQLLERNEVFRTAIGRCGDALERYTGWSLQEALSAPEARARLDEVDVVQPLIFAVQVALAAVWEAWGIRAAAVVGHSMGEVAAAHVAGALELEDAARIITARSRLMRRVAGQGAMMVVDLEAARVREELGEDLDIAAVNSHRSTAIAGPPGAIQALMDRLLGRNVFCRRIRTDVAFHSRRMDGLLEDLEALLEGIRPAPVQLPLFSTVTAAATSGPELEPGYWVRNLRETVRFSEVVRQLIGTEHNVFLELSPHPVLLTAVEQDLRQLAREAPLLPSMLRGDSDELTLLNGLGTLYMRGAEVRWEALYPVAGRPARLPRYPWQRQKYWLEPVAPPRAGRDAPVLAPAAASAERAPDDSWQYEVVWEPLEPEPRATAAPSTSGVRSRWILFADGAGVGDALAGIAAAADEPVLIVRSAGERAAPADGVERTSNHMEAGGAPVVWVDASSPEDLRQRVVAWAGEAPSDARRWQVIHLWSLDTPPMAELEGDLLDAHQRRACGSVLHLVQALVDARIDDVRLWVVTRGAQATGRPAPASPTDLPAGGGANGQDAPVSPVQATVWGLGRCIALEHPELWGGLVDLDPNAGDAAGAGTIDAPGGGSPRGLQLEAATLRALVGRPGDEDHFALRGDRRLVPRLIRAAPPEPSPALEIDANATYLVTGGLGGLGLQLADWLVALGARHLLLTGRTGLPEPAAPAALPPDSPTARAISAVQALEAAGVTVTVVRADVADEGDMTKALAAVSPSHPLRGVIHAAGVPGFRPLQSLELPELEAILRPKVRGTWNLDRLTRTLELDFFVCFSSIAAVWGSATMGAYAAANHFLDVFAPYRAAAGSPALTVAWGRWEGEGMGRTSQENLRYLEQIGLRSIPPARALALLEQLIASRRVHRTVGHVDWSRYKPIFEARRRRPLLARLEADGPGATRTTRTAFIEALELAPVAERRPRLVRQLQEAAAQVLRLEAGSGADWTQGFFQMGMDSIMSVELRDRLQSALGRPLPATLAFEYPTVDALAGYLSQHVLSMDFTDSTGPADAPGEAGPQAPALDALDEDALLALLARRLDRIQASRSSP